MAYTINVDSFSSSNIREESELIEGVEAEATSVKLRSTQGFTSGEIVYFGVLGREGCEKAVVDIVSDETTLSLTAPLKLAHRVHTSVTAVLGSKIRIYRAPNLTDRVPADTDFEELVVREIDPDQTSTYYQDSTGGAAFWYCHTYFNETTLEETERSEPIRGQDFGNYASLAAIREEAGFKNARNLSDSVIAESRRQAQSEINSALAGSYTVPFQPVPEIVRTLTIQLAVALLKITAYGSVAPHTTNLRDVRAQIDAYKDGSLPITDEDGQNLGPSGVSSFFGDGGHTFRMEDIY